MKSNGMMMVIVVICASTLRCACAADGNWSTDFETAEREAKASGQTLLVHFYADWCGPCRAMERSVLTTQDVNDALADGIVAVKVNSDHRKDLVRRFGVTSLPTDVFVGTDGTQLSKHVGSPGKTAYIARLDKYKVKAAVDSEVLIADADDSLPPKPPITESRSETATSRSTTGAKKETAVSREIAAADPSVDSAAVVERSASKPVITVPVVRTKALAKVADQRIGLNGYSPVTLSRSTEWIKGQDEFKSTFQGVCYRFQNAEELQQFNSDPKKYVPAMHGYDAVAFKKEFKMLTGAIELGTRYRDRYYFFSSTSNRDEFLRNPSRYTKSSDLTFFFAKNESATGL